MNVKMNVKMDGKDFTLDKFNFEIQIKMILEDLIYAYNDDITVHNWLLIN